jgi:hypothetical protein
MLGIIAFLYLLCVGCVHSTFKPLMRTEPADHAFSDHGHRILRRLPVAPKA